MLPASWSLKDGYRHRQIQELETLERVCLQALSTDREDPILYNLMQKINGMGISSRLWDENLPANDRLHALRRMFENLQMLYPPHSTPAAPKEDTFIGDSSPIEILSEDALYTVLSFLDPTSAVAASKVCKAWQSLNRSLLWQGENHVRVSILKWRNYIGYVIDCLRGVPVPLEAIFSENSEAVQKLSSDAIEAFQTLSETLKTVPETLYKILHREPSILKKIQEILDRIGLHDQKSLTRFCNSIELSFFKKQVSEKEFSALREAYGDLLIVNPQEFRQTLKLKDLTALFDKLSKTLHLSSIGLINMSVIVSCMNRLYDPCPQGEESSTMKLLLKCGYWKKAWKLLDRSDTLIIRNNLSKIWTKNLRKIIPSLVTVGDGENAYRLANHQEQKLKIKLLQVMGIAYVNLNQKQHVKPILKLLNQEGTAKAIENRSKILEELLVKKNIQGNFEEALRYFERLRSCTSPRNQLRILYNLALHRLKEHPSQREILGALLQKEFPNLLQELSKDTCACHEFFVQEVFSYIALLCKMEEIKLAQGLMTRALSSLEKNHKNNNSSSFIPILDKNIPYLLCKIGNKATAQKLVDEAIESIRKRPHDTPKSWAIEILYRAIPSHLCKIGETAKAEELMVLLINSLRESSSDKKFFKTILDRGILLFLCKIGQVAKARELLDQAIEVFRREYPGADEFFEQLIKQKIFINLCTMGDIDEAERLFARMPANFFCSDLEGFHGEHDTGLKELTRKLLENRVATGATSEEAQDLLNKIVRILGMLIEDPDKHHLIETITSWQAGEVLPLSKYTDDPYALKYIFTFGCTTGSSSDSSDSTSGSDSSSSGSAPAVLARPRFLMSLSSEDSSDSTPSDSTPSSSGSGSD